MRHYCTYFDSRYLSRGLVLHDSLRRVSGPFRLWVLCLDEACYEALSALRPESMVPLRLTEVEAADPEFHACRANRSLVEYYFTATPVLLSYLFAANPGIDIVTYLDADIGFFKDPEFLFDEFAEHAVQIVPHRYSERNRALAEWGVYNVGWVAFRRDADGLACLAWWRRSCIEWCYDRLEADRFADQKYLDQFPQRFARVQIVTHPGVNAAPWNLDTGTLRSTPDGELRFGEQPLIFFHFHKLRRVAPMLWRTRLSDYGAALDRPARALLYRPYIRRLASTERRLRRQFPALRPSPPLLRGGARRALWSGLRGALGGLLRRDTIVYPSLM
jgi:hypothetical protein